jgi:Rps23 Pro-64 3,4-dihydroxylase Tpa1-like proline 4-hydroxylase
MTPIERTRAVTMIFFLNNTDWREGDGGECGLYASREGNLEPEARIAPINNSILVFECTPHSLHRFLANHAAPRDSVILWLHRQKELAVERWGERAIVKWSR